MWDPRAGSLPSTQTISLPFPYIFQQFCVNKFQPYSEPRPLKSLIRIFFFMIRDTFRVNTRSKYHYLRLPVSVRLDKILLLEPAELKMSILHFWF